MREDMALDFLWEGGNCPRRGQGHGFLLIGRWGWFTWSSVTSAEEVEWGEKKVVCEFQYVSRLRDVSVACVCVFPWVQLEFNLNSDAIFSRVWQPQTHIHTPFLVVSLSASVFFSIHDAHQWSLFSGHCVPVVCSGDTWNSSQIHVDVSIFLLSSGVFFLSACANIVRGGRCEAYVCRI